MCLLLLLCFFLFSLLWINKNSFIHSGTKETSAVPPDLRFQVCKLHVYTFTCTCGDCAGKYPTSKRANLPTF